MNFEKKKKNPRGKNGKVLITTVMFNYLIDSSIMYFCVLIKVKMSAII